MIVADLDGTLLKNGILSRGDADTMQQIQKNGIKLMVATGRNIADGSDYIEKLQLRLHDGAIAFSDGQYIQDFSDQSFIENEFLNYADDLKHIASLGLSNYSYAQAFCKTGDYLVVQSIFSKFYMKACILSILKRQRMNRVLRINRDYPIVDIEKIVFYAEETVENMAKLSPYYEAFYVHDNNRYEIKRKGVNKGAAVEAIQNKYRFQNDEIAVFGNDENDVSMFERYTNSFVVENAPDTVKGKANHVISNGKVADTIAALVREGALQ
jgi:Cof subfamily protein (haloacid dehalogenase superfamily)